jgi:signal transduction histidine kinase/CheY-like chemotaxis protein
MAERERDALEERVLVLAPTARDAASSRDLLAGAGVPSFLCGTIADVCREIDRGAGLAIVTAESVLGDKEGCLAQRIKSQPPWSDLPVIVLTTPEPDSPKLLKVLDGVGPMMLMKRPVQVSTLLSAIRTALRDRRRQYRVRDLLAERDRMVETLRAEREELVKRTGRLRLLWETASVLLTSEEPAAMLRGLFGKIAAHLGLDVYFNYMIDESGDGLRLESSAGIPEEMVRLMGRLAFGQAICGTVAESGEAMVIPDITTCDDPRLANLKRMGVRFFACNPLRAEGRVLGTLSFGSRLRDRFDDDELDFFRTITHYVTVAYERLRFVRELRDADRKKDDFIALLAHELRNPLAPLRNGLQVLRLSEEGSVRDRSQQMMERQLSHMVRLIDDLMDVSRISRNKMELRRAPVELADVVSSAVETVRGSIEKARHELIVSLPGRPVRLDADLTRLAQVFSNLLTNSAKYTPAGGKIWLTAATRGGAVEVTVRDTGIGIPAEALPRIFDMFSQVDRSMERAAGGLGIGLALVKGLVEMHDGTVTAASAGPGRGSTFTISLPMLPAEEAAAHDAPDLDHGSPDPPRRILVVDDNRDGAESLVEMLRLLGNEVLTAHDGLQAIERAGQFRPDVILMDIGMPLLNGLEATRRIREQAWGSTMKVIAVTGWGQDADRERSRTAGCDGHLVKPVGLADLQRLLAELRPVIASA